MFSRSHSLVPSVDPLSITINRKDPEVVRSKRYLIVFLVNSSLKYVVTIMSTIVVVVSRISAGDAPRFAVHEVKILVFVNPKVAAIADLHLERAHYLGDFFHGRTCWTYKGIFIATASFFRVSRKNST